MTPGLTINSSPYGPPYSAASKPLVGQAPTLGKGYPADFTKLYNAFASAYAQHPAEVANEHAGGGGPWTSRMQQLDDLKDAHDWTRMNAPSLGRLPLGVQQNIYNTPDTPEGQAPNLPNDPTGQMRYGESMLQPESPQANDIRRLFGNQIQGGYRWGI